MCRELASLLNLLPCKVGAGISSLPDDQTLFDAQWQSARINDKPVSEDGGKYQLRMEQTVNMAHGSEGALGSRESGFPGP